MKPLKILELFAGVGTTTIKGSAPTTDEETTSDKANGKWVKTTD